MPIAAQALGGKSLTQATRIGVLPWRGEIGTRSCKVTRFISVGQWLEPSWKTGGSRYRQGCGGHICPKIAMFMIGRIQPFL